MNSNLLQMKAAPPVERFHRTVETLEASVNFEIQSVANEDGTWLPCVVDRKRQTKCMDDVFAAQVAGVSSTMV